MKRILIISTLFLSLLLNQSIYSQNNEEKEKIAVLGFGGNVQNWIKETLTNQLETEIVNLGRFTIVNRRSIQAAIEELKINLTGFIDDDQSIKTGEFLSAHKLIVGEANYCNVTHYMKQVTRTVNGQSRTFNVRIYKAEISISAKIIEVEKNVISEGVNLVGIGENENSNGAITAAVNNSVFYFINKIKEIYQLEAQIIKKDSREVYISMGKDNGIKEGMVFKVFRVEDGLLDSYSDESFSIENEVGLVYIKSVYPKYSSAKIIRGVYKINQGDKVKESLNERLTRIALMGSYSAMPVETKITESLTNEKITESAYTGISIFADSYHKSNAYELQFGFLRLDNLRGIIADLNFRRKYKLLPEVLDSYVGGGVGFVSLEQKISDPDSAWILLNKDGSDKDVRDNSLTLAATVSFRMTLMKLIQPYAEIGWRYCNTLDEWKAEYKTGKITDGKAEKKKISIPDEFLKYPSIQIGGFTYRVGLMLSF